jgi:hypothetical protein
MIVGYRKHGNERASKGALMMGVELKGKTILSL